MHGCRKYPLTTEKRPVCLTGELVRSGRGEGGRKGEINPQLSKFLQLVLHPVLKEQDVWLIAKTEALFLARRASLTLFCHRGWDFAEEPSATRLLKHHWRGPQSGSVHSICIRGHRVCVCVRMTGSTTGPPSARTLHRCCHLLVERRHNNLPLSLFGIFIKTRRFLNQNNRLRVTFIYKSLHSPQGSRGVGE